MARSAATRRAKGILPGGNAAEPRPAPDVAPGRHAGHRQRVVADVRHGSNYFHKLYYWADF
jgi:hypothetical protein